MAKLILLAGVSRSGKSTLATKLVHDLPNAIVLHQDEFILDQSALPLIKGRIDWENPETIDWDRLVSAHDEANEQYDFIIIEGIFALSSLRLIKASAFKILLTLDREEFIKRRSQETRWGDEPDWFIHHVWESHLACHNPHNLNLDFELRNASPTEYVKLLVQLKS